MQAYIQFHLAAIQSEVLTPGTLSNQSKMPLRIAMAQKLITQEGAYIIQSVSHYLAHLKLFEAVLNADASLKYTIAEPAFLLFADLSRNSCQLCYRPAGEYELQLLLGMNQFLIASLRTDWLIYKCQHLAVLSSFTSSLERAADQPKDLPAFGMAASLFRSLKMMDNRIKDMGMDSEGYVFINECINKYYHRLIGSDTINAYYQEKGRALVAFVKENFATPLVDDMPALASRFMVSERTLARLAKLTFGIPLHEQVINTRMTFAYNQLVTTAKPIYEIAALSGYQDPHYFSKAFKKYHGISPKAVERPVKLLLAI
ncbi:AraC-like DNA-binding protein [Pedobacter sp. AK017]|uniref:helix-turn-helix transcriptional regulator n=1 Tax=Pedobacter sp. AK017 TaxID=2723073 RepID=UPI00161A8E40|nr:helix-turn-helix transcriptional regulator [Pedobacter sp. AK017]MBB5436595.1 AraC-like DNA-binding protein [Pedobacter sp. AK017]